MSNFTEAHCQAILNYTELVSGSDGKEAVKELLRRGVEDDHFKILTSDEAKDVLRVHHSFSFQTTAFKESSLTTNLGHVSNPSNISSISQMSLNLAREHPPNLSNLIPWALSVFTLFHVPYSSDIKSAYRWVKVDPSCQPYQLLLLYDFDQLNWADFHKIILQKGLLYGAV